jgi:DNA-binding transcriptional LysR family regulator
MLRYTFRQLEVFVQIVEAGSFGVCARRLAISQVSISAHMRLLEAHLGCRLFRRRRGAAATLTEAGRRTYERAKDLLRAGSALASPLDRDGAALGRRKLMIAAHGYIAERFSRALADFSRHHPEVEIELERRSFEGVLEGLQDEEVDLGFFISHGPVPQIPSVRAWREDVGFYVGASHPLAKRSVVSPSELARYPFAYLPSRSHLRAQIDSILAELGIQGCPTAQISDDHLFVMESLADGRSFACLFTLGTDELPAAGNLKRVPLSRPVPSLDVRYSTRAPLRQDPTARHLTDCLATISLRSQQSSTIVPRS